MLLSQIPLSAYIVAIVVLEFLGFLWFKSSVRRGTKENVSIKFEKVTFISSLIIGAVGIALLIIVSTSISQN